jgi:hypothetical protein
LQPHLMSGSESAAALAHGSANCIPAATGSQLWLVDPQLNEQLTLST